jgi:hypothetical protein
MVAEPWKVLGETTKEFIAPLAAGVSLGSVALYLPGYLALRFHLTALGIGTDLAVLDERYLFAGAKFLVYLVSSVPTIALVVLVLAAVVALPGWLVSLVIGARGRQAVGRWWANVLAWWRVPTRLALLGVILAVGLIQFVMRQCFVLSNLLLAPQLPEPAWLGTLLLARTEGPRALYFAGLVAGTVITGTLGLISWYQKGHTAWSVLLTGLLSFFVGVQVLLLPVNYGILIADKTIPRVSSLSGQEALGASEDIWLVWEGKESVTYLTRIRAGDKESRKLVTLPRGQVQRTELTAYEPILRVLFAAGTP